jgi:hypothetical protein
MVVPVQVRPSAPNVDETLINTGIVDVNLDLLGATSL